MNMMISYQELVRTFLSLPNNTPVYSLQRHLDVLHHGTPHEARAKLTRVMGKGLETLAASSGFKGKAQRIDQRHKIKPSVLTVHVLYRVEPGNYLPLRDNIPKATTKHSGNLW
ncbi:TPA: hypothetical protein ACQ7GZ_004455 [Klebsiella pneumoniae]